MSSPQGTAEWLQEKAGHASASRFKDILAKGKGVSRRNYCTHLVTERLINGPVETFKNAYMESGNETEAMARIVYEAATGNIVETAGFIKHPKMTWVGASPDGLIGDDGGCEIKCHTVSTIHIETILNGMPNENLAQVQGNMWVTGRKWWDFASFDPKMPDHLKLYTQRIPRDDAYIQMLLEETALFLVEVDELYKRLMERKQP